MFRLLYHSVGRFFAGSSGRRTAKIAVDAYITLRDVVTGTGFLRVTRLNPNKLILSVNGRRADDDLLLVSGDVVTFNILGEKALPSARDVIKKLRPLVGLYFGSDKIVN